MNYFLPVAFLVDFAAAFLAAGFLVDLAGVFLEVFFAAAILVSFRGRPRMLPTDPLGHRLRERCFACIVCYACCREYPSHAGSPRKDR